MNSASRSARLAQQQRDLLHAIFTIENIAVQAIKKPSNGISNTQKSSLNPHSIRGLKTYQANAAASALRSLQAAYPVIVQLIGDDAFEHLALDFWAQHPPVYGDLAQWGDKLTEFIASISALKNEPYLSDVAKAEWAMHTASTAADLSADFASFSLLAEHDPDALSLQLAPGTALIQSKFPIASILTAHLYAASRLEEVGRKLQQDNPEIALVYRNGFRPVISSCTVDEAGFIHQILAGKSLLMALEKPADLYIVNALGEFDFNSWLPKAVQTGLLLGALVL